MGKQSTLGKFWGKPGALQDPVKMDEDKKEAEKSGAKDAASTRDKSGKTTENKASTPAAQHSGPSPSSKGKLAW